MASVLDLVPSIDALLSLPPEEVAPYVLEAIVAQQQNGMVILNNLVVASTARRNEPSFRQYEKKIELVISEAWNWLQVQGLLVPASGSNGANGWLVLSRKAWAISNRDDFRRFQDAAAFPKSLLHPSIADKVWLDIMRGDLADAVFAAFRAVEEAVRAAGNYAAGDIGVDLMRKAFHPESGPLADRAQEKSEREALAHLFAGAIGSYKNPHSHRTVTINDPKEAQEMVVLAWHLLRIVDSRSAATKN